MLNKLRSLLDRENTYFFGVKNYIIAAIVLFVLVDSALLGLHGRLDKLSSKQVAGVAANQDVEVEVEDEAVSGSVSVEDESDGQDSLTDDEAGKILQDAAYITREELEDTNISVPSDDVDASASWGESSTGDSDPANGSTQNQSYTAEEQAVINAAEAAMAAIEDSDGQAFYKMLASDLQGIFSEEDVVKAFTVQDVTVTSTQVVSDPEMVGDGYAQIKLRFNYADQTSEDYWVYLVREDSIWRLLGTDLVD
jgi:hypothetical protein